MSTISAVTFDLATLKTYNEATQAFVDTTLTGSLYTVAGVTDATGALRKLSMAELVMVVCLARAAEKEAAVIELMKEMSNTTEVLNALTDIEKKLLEGTSLDNITDTYTYQGMDYSAKDFLAIVVGGAPADTSGWDSSDMRQIYGQLQDNHILDVTGAYSFDGTTYTKAYVYLYNVMEHALSVGQGSGVMSSYQLMNFYNVCDYVDSLPAGAVPSDSDLMNLSPYSSINLWSGMTKEDLVQSIDDTYKNTLLNAVQTLDWSSGTGHVADASSYLPSDTDELITQIEAKMDSLNSFSQQKMIELQSETNKRDQAYDMITNILKSLNTVQVGIVNNM